MPALMRSPAAASLTTSGEILFSRSAKLRVNPAHVLEITMLAPKIAGSPVRIAEWREGRPWTRDGHDLDLALSAGSRHHLFA